jgi:hypothetical protein
MVKTIDDLTVAQRNVIHDISMVDVFDFFQPHIHHR